MAFISSLGCQKQESASYDLVIYSATPAAITAAVQASKDGLSVVIANPNEHIGGLTTGGLGWTDKGVEESIGGLSLAFYKEIYQHYQQASAWKYQEMNTYQGLSLALREEQEIFWTFEPHVASSIFVRWLKEHKIKIVKNAELLSIQKVGNQIQSIQTTQGDFLGKYFMDCSYEGDLFVKAGCSHHLGRESRDTYQESLAGVLSPYDTSMVQPKQWFGEDVDPYDEEGNLLFGISADTLAAPGTEDKLLQAYVFRTCLTDVPENRIEITKPERYDPAKYELLARLIQTKDAWELGQLLKMSPIPNRKTDINDHSPYSMDFIGANYDYPAGSKEVRQAIIQDHYDYNIGMLYFLGHDERVPENVRQEMLSYGLPKDEYVENGNWSPQLYIREAYRLVGEYVMTQKDCQQEVHKERSIGCGSYGPDSHHCQRVLVEDQVVNEGNFLEKKKAYEIPYEAILPLQEETQNLLVPVCLSSSHVAYGSVRMEPVFMILGQSAAAAVNQSIEAGIGVHEIKYQDLKQRLLSLGQVLTAPE